MFLCAISKGAFGNWLKIYSVRLCQSLYGVTKAAAGAVCAIGNCVPNSHSMNKEALKNFKGLSQDEGVGEVFCASPFK
jgi:hypothetical protein